MHRELAVLDAADPQANLVPALARNAGFSRRGSMGLLRELFGPSQEEMWRRLCHMGSAYEDDPHLVF